MMRIKLRYCPEIEVQKLEHEALMTKKRFSFKLQNLRRMGQFQELMCKLSTWIDDNIDLFYEDKQFSSLILGLTSHAEKAQLFVNNERKSYKFKNRLKERLVDCVEKILKTHKGKGKFKAVVEMKDYFKNNDFRTSEFYVDDKIKKCAGYFLSAGQA